MKTKEVDELNKYEIRKDVYSLNHILEKRFGKVGTKKGQKNLEKILKNLI